MRALNLMNDNQQPCGAPRAPSVLFFAACFFFLNACSDTYSNQRRDEMIHDIVITNATILDGRGSDEPPKGHVAIKNGLISSISIGEQPFGLEVIDAENQYLLPGFIDAHVHILVPLCRSFASGNIRFDRELSEEMASTLLSFGVTTVRSPATPTESGLKLRNDLNSGEVRGPYALASAELINNPRLSEQQLRQYVSDALIHEPDYFKVYARLTPDQVSVVIDEAARAGIPVIGHLGKTSWKEGAEMGIDFLTHAADWSPKSLKPEHRADYLRAISATRAMRARLDWLEFVDLESDEIDEMIDALVDNRVVVDPTLVAYDAKFSAPNYPRYRGNQYLSAMPRIVENWSECRSFSYNWTQTDFERWRRLFPKLQRLVWLMHDRGVIMITGSDTANEWVLPGEGLHQEFELLYEAGISPAEILKMTGVNAATSLGLTDRGVIEVGKRADLVLLHENPLEDISNTRKIVSVFLKGERIRDALEEGLVQIDNHAP